MFKQDLIYVTSTTTTLVATDGVIPLQFTKRRRGYASVLGANAVQLNKAGYYHITGLVIFEGTNAGIASIAVFKNGVEQNDSTTAVTTNATATTLFTLPIDMVVRVFCNEAPTLITLVNTGVGITVTNTQLTIEYEG